MVVRREHVRGERSAGRPVDQRSGHPCVGRRHLGRAPGLAARVPVPVVPVRAVLPSHRAHHDRGGRRELRPAVPDARVLRPADRHQDHRAPVRHLDRQLRAGHAPVRLQHGARLLRQTGTQSA